MDKLPRPLRFVLSTQMEMCLVAGGMVIAGAMSRFAPAVEAGVVVVGFLVFASLLPPPRRD